MGSIRDEGHWEDAPHFISEKCIVKLSKVISYDDAIELLRRDFPSKHDMFVREKMKKQRESMVMNVSAEEMPAQLRKAAKSVSVTSLVTPHSSMR